MKLSLLLILAISLTACGFAQKQPPPQVVPEPVYISFDCGDPPDVDRLDAKEVKWEEETTNTEGNMEISTDFYANLGENTSAMIKWMKQMVNRDDFHLGCIAESKAKVEEMNNDE